MEQTLIGLLMVAVTAAGLYWMSRNRYKCPSCARPVRWKDVTCTHCGEDMKFQHRTGPSTAPPRRVTHLKPMSPPVRSKRNRG